MNDCCNRPGQEGFDVAVIGAGSAGFSAAIAAADAVLLFGHGHGESDLRRQLLRHVETHRRDLLARIVAIETVDASALKPEGLLALARAHFGNLPRRHPVRNAGQELRPG